MILILFFFLGSEAEGKKKKKVTKLRQRAGRSKWIAHVWPRAFCSRSSRRRLFLKGLEHFRTPKNLKRVLGSFSFYEEKSRGSIKLLCRVWRLCFWRTPNGRPPSGGLWKYISLLIIPSEGENRWVGLKDSLEIGSGLYAPWNLVESVRCWHQGVASICQRLICNLCARTVTLTR